MSDDSPLAQLVVIYSFVMSLEVVATIAAVGTVAIRGYPTTNAISEYKAVFIRNLKCYLELEDF